MKNDDKGQGRYKDPFFTVISFLNGSHMTDGCLN